MVAIAVSLVGVVAALSSEPSVWRGALAGGAVLVFLVAFFFGIRGRGRPVPPGLIARVAVIDIALAAALTIADRSDWAFLFYFVVSLVGIRLARPWSIAGVIAVVVIASTSAALGGDAGDKVGGMALGLLGIGAAMVAFGEIIRANFELRKARAEVARLAIADERARFARDLHDLLGHSLSVIALKSELARRRLPDDPNAAADEVADIEKVTREALREVRDAVSGYRRPVLDAELAGARTALDAAGITTTIERPAVELPPEVEAVLAWTVREAATNVIRHSGARTSEIRVVPALDHASVEVLDDGHGPNGSAGHGTGLVGLQERLRAAGGRLEAGPREDGAGFRVRAVVPVASGR
jgi:two-component system, NarL family, sensor histidine kinase DesK